MPDCSIHPGRPEAMKVGGKGYCKRCQSDIDAAIKQVDRHVEPKECFVWYQSSAKGWQPMTGFGCAHYCAHERNAKKGAMRCLAGHTVRVKDLVKGLAQVKDVARVKKGHLWANDKLNHCGMVDAVKANMGGPPQITIRHDSNRQGKVARNDWATHFKSGGGFYK